jgi:hypothetical protein
LHLVEDSLERFTKTLHGSFELRRVTHGKESCRTEPRTSASSSRIIPRAEWIQSNA